MAKSPVQETHRTTEGEWFTATVTIAGTNGSPLYEKFARDEEHLKEILRAKHPVWESIKIVKGRDPGPLRFYHRNHEQDLSAVLGQSVLSVDGTPSPFWGSGCTDETARAMWDKFKDEYSYGLVVSDLPHFIKPDMEGFHIIALSPENVRNVDRWDAITLAMYEKFVWWKNSHGEAVNRRRRITHPSAEDLDILGWNEEVLKGIEKLTTWTYKSFVGQFFPGCLPNLLDLENPRLYRIPSGELIPITNLHPDLLRVDFWRRLFAIWDGPVNHRPESLRVFLDHHHRNGGEPEVFRDLVLDTVRRVRIMTSNPLKWASLADKLEGWLQALPQQTLHIAPRGSLPFEREASAQYDQFLREEIPGLSICPYPLRLHVGTRETYPEVSDGPCINFSWMLNVERWKDIGRAVQQSVDRLQDGPLKLELRGWSYASIVPAQPSTQRDVPNPRQYLLDGTMVPDVRFERRGRLSEAANEVLVKFGGMVADALKAPLNLRERIVNDLLDHHFEHGGNSTEFVKHVERIIPNYRVDEFQRILAAWVVGAKQRLSMSTASMLTKAAKPWPDLKSLALFYAYRWEVDGAAVDFTTVGQADIIAINAGHKSGKTLLEHYRRYTTGPPENRRIERTKEGGRPGDVVKRFETVITRLAEYPLSLPMAREEQSIVRTRSNERED